MTKAIENAENAGTAKHAEILRQDRKDFSGCGKEKETKMTLFRQSRAIL
jgi:hypothetical protein